MNKKIENDLKKTVRNAYTDVDIPLSLSPEIMYERIYKEEGAKDEDIPKIVPNDKVRRNKNRRHRMAFVGTAIAACFILMSVSYTKNDTINPLSLLENKSLMDQFEEAEDFEMLHIESYDDLEKVVKENTELFESVYVTGTLEKDIMVDGAVSDDIAEEAVPEAEEAVPEAEEPGSAGDDNTGSYTDTNVHVEGIDEADRYKTDGKYIYIVNSEVVNIFSVDKGKASYISSIDYGTYVSEVYVYNDYLVILGTDYEEGKNEAKIRTMVSIYDITDRAKPKKISTNKQDGYYSTSRRVGDYIYLISDQDYGYMPLEDTDLRTYVNDTEIDCKDIYISGYTNGNNFSIISAINITEGKVTDNKKIMVGNSKTYVNDKNIYIASAAYDVDKKDNFFNTKTRIVKLSYSEGNLKVLCKGKIEGYLDSQFSMDEYNDNLRVVATKGSGFDLDTSNSLYILNDKLKIRSKIDKLAKGESIYSARFDKEMAYFVTFKQTDPLFTADLSDPDNPKITSELKLPGYSDYLQKYDDDHLFGIGYEQKGEFSFVKIAMYDISDPNNVIEADKVLIKGLQYTNATYDHKGLLMDRETGLIGFYGDGFDTKTYDRKVRYYLYSFDVNKGKFNKTAVYDLSGQLEQPEFSSDCRGIRIDDNFYIAIESIDQYMDNSYKSAVIGYKLGKKNPISIAK